MIKVVVVEDSVVQARHISRLIEEGGDAHVAGIAGDVGEAVALIARVRPDVVTMDLEIPGGEHNAPGGIVAISDVMEQRAVPILVLSAYAGSRDSALAIEALAAGAVDVFPKPSVWTAEEAAQLRRRIAVLSRLRMTTRHSPRRGVTPLLAARQAGTTRRIIGLVASTGGPPALRTVIGQLAGVPAPILVVQHIHGDFAASFGEWLQEVTGVPTVMARDGDALRPGTVHLAPAGHHLRLGASWCAEVSPEPADLLTRPSGDQLLLSLARHAGTRGVGCVLTGMGDDGARGLLAMKEAGATTFAQDSQSCVVDGMPKVARELGAAQTVLGIDKLGGAIAAAAGGVRRRP